MSLYLKGKFVRHLHQKSPHLHFVVTSAKDFGPPPVLHYSNMKGQWYVVQPNKMGRREYDFLDTEGYAIGRKDVVIGKIAKSWEHKSWWRFIGYEERLS